MKTTLSIVPDTTTAVFTNTNLPKPRKQFTAITPVKKDKGSKDVVSSV